MAISKFKNRNKATKDRGHGGRLTKAQRKHKRLREESRQRQDRNILPEYQRKLPPFKLEHQFRFTCIKHDAKSKGNLPVDISRLVTSVTWSDVGPVLTGEITLSSPISWTVQHWQGVEDGNVIKCQVRMGAKWVELWRMRIWVPQEELESQSGVFTLADDLRLLQHNEGDFKYKKSKKQPKHKHGWEPWEIVIDVLKRFRVRVGRLAKPKLKNKITDLTDPSTNVLDIVERAYKHASDENGKTYILRWKNGRLNVDPLRRQPALYSMRRQISSALITHQRGKKFFTALTVTASKSKHGSKKKEKIEVEIVDNRAVKHYGYIHGKLNLKRQFDSKEAVRTQGQRRLARQIRRQTDNTIHITHPGIPFVRRGDAIRIHLPEFGFTDKQRPKQVYKGGYFSVLYVKSITHNVNPGSYTMDMEFSQQDAFAEQKESEREAKDKSLREEKHKARKAKNKAE